MNRVFIGLDFFPVRLRLCQNEKPTNAKRTASAISIKAKLHQSVWDEKEAGAVGVEDAASLSSFFAVFNSLSVASIVRNCRAASHAVLSIHCEREQISKYSLALPPSLSPSASSFCIDRILILCFIPFDFIGASLTRCWQRTASLSRWTPLSTTACPTRPYRWLMWRTHTTLRAYWLKPRCGMFSAPRISRRSSRSERVSATPCRWLLAVTWRSIYHTWLQSLGRKSCLGTMWFN